MTTTVKPLNLAELHNTMLARFAAELHSADREALDDLAQLAECNCRTDIGQRMRDLVDDERARRVFTTSLTLVSARCLACGLKTWDADDLEPGDFVCVCVCSEEVGF